jgi:hypothetical protein
MEVSSSNMNTQPDQEPVVAIKEGADGSKEYPFTQYYDEIMNQIDNTGENIKKIVDTH